MRKEGAQCIRLLLKKVSLATSIDLWVPELDGTITPPRLRTLTPAEESLYWAQTKDWLSANVVEQGPRLPWYNNPVFVAKKNGTIRTCIDCRPVNAITKEFDWPLPKLQELRHSLAGKQWFSRIDLKDAFFRISIPEPYRNYTAFTVHGKSFRFKRMPFGLKTAPSIFQRFMDTVLCQHKPHSYWYMDDILIGGETRQLLTRRTRKVLGTLEKARITINKDKSEFETQATLFAGMWIFPSGLGPQKGKVLEALNIPPPKTKKEKQSALGLVSYLRDFIPLMAHFTAQLYPGKGNTLSQDEYETQWRKLLNHIAKAVTTLSHWNEQEDADLYTDASGNAVAAVLIQNQRIVTVASRKLRGAEVRYSTTDREHLSLVMAAERFKLFLHRKGGTTRVWNDHAALITRRTNNIMPRQARWQERIETWIPTITHVKGEKNPADWFSRFGEELRGGTIFV